MSVYCEPELQLQHPCIVRLPTISATTLGNMTPWCFWGVYMLNNRSQCLCCKECMFVFFTPVLLFYPLSQCWAVNPEDSLMAAGAGP
jgi:hypothetical protein